MAAGQGGDSRGGEVDQPTVEGGGETREDQQSGHPDQQPLPAWHTGVQYISRQVNRIQYSPGHEVPHTPSAGQAALQTVQRQAGLLGVAAQTGAQSGRQDLGREAN